MAASEHSSITRTVTGRSLEERPCNPDVLPCARQAPFNRLATETIFTYASPYVALPVKFDSHMNLLPNFAVNHPQRPLPNFAVNNRQRALPPFVIDYPTNYLDLTVLSMVCKRWRTTVLAHHSLWNTILVRSSIITLKAWDSWGFRQLCDCLERSGDRPLKIRMELEKRSSLCRKDMEEHPTIIAGVLNRLVVHSARWNSLDLKCHSMDELNLKFQSVPMPSLQRFAFRTTSGFIKTDVLRKFRIPWTQITDMMLSLHNVYMHDLNKLLVVSQLSGSLISLTFLDSPRYYMDVSKNRGTIVLPNLRQLSFLGACRNILDMLKCPALEYLAIGNGEEHEIIQFFDSSSCMLITVDSGPCLNWL